MDLYQSLSRAQLDVKYLHTNSTTHEFLFGALAELLDNARDAGATRIEVNAVEREGVRGGYMLCFLDDGEGMDPGEAASIITFGKSSKRALDSSMIGQYGNGLKSGSMRIAKDLILFTKKGETMSCLFLSRTFHEEESIEEVIVPIPSFDSSTKTSLASTNSELEKHMQEMDLILKYSPYHKHDEFMAQFDKITGESGTLVILYNLKVLDNGEPELDINTDNKDILMANPYHVEGQTDDRDYLERRSFRAYSAVLYVEPKMKVYLRGHKVQTKRLPNSLYKPRMYKYTSSRFKTRSENEAAKAMQEAKWALEKAKEAESKAKSMDNKYTGVSKESRAKVRQAQIEAAELRKDANFKKQVAERKQKSLKDPKTLSFIFGMNIENRQCDGVFVYNCNRLIKMYERVGPQLEGGVNCSGVLGIVDVPYLVLEPTHNKQDFADAKEYRHLLRAMGEHLVQYWKDTGIVQQGVTKFWENFGYVSPSWKDPPSVDAKYLRKRAMQIPITIQCDNCLKWRVLPFSASNLNKEIPEYWVCSMNPDHSHNRCTVAEQKCNIPMGSLKKETKSAEDKKKDLMEGIRKNQEKLQQLEKTTTVTSRNHLPPRQSSQETPPRRNSNSRPVGKASPVVTRIEKTMITSQSREKVVSKPVGKASPVVNSSRRYSASSTTHSNSASNQVSKRTPPPTKKSDISSKAVRQSKTQESRKRATAQKRRGSSVREPVIPSDTESDDIPTKKKRSDSSRKDVEKTKSRTHKAKESASSEEAIEAETDASVSDIDENNEEIGTKVEACVDGTWYPGQVVRVSVKPNSSTNWKIKFDKNPKDKYDKWYEKNSKNLRTMEAPDNSVAEEDEPANEREEEEEEEDQEDRKEDIKPVETTVKTIEDASPTSSTDPSAVTKIAEGYRSCLRYFLPPSWTINQEEVSNLSVEDLINFPLDNFLDHYEKGLRKLVGTYQSQAESKAKEAEEAKAKLSGVRKMIVKLLKSINEDIDIDGQADGDEVDELLAACVSQAVQGE
ncbi:ATPase MORC2A-like isoform X2 [Ptychodera flava]|uniref:ATPase MORC2A-like isoform X2 n=1 Tax=Ptychodera flava TaxID=63121 RepID=UPI00396AA4CA